MFLSLTFFFISNTALDSVRDYLKDKKSFEVRFEQKVKQSIFPDDIEEAKGRIVFERPRSLRWIYESPEKKEIVFKEGQAYILRGKEKEEIPDARSLGVEESFSFLWGESNLNLFELKSKSKAEVVIKPKDSKKAQFQSMTVDVKDSKIEQVVVKDRLDGESRIRFFDWRFQKR